MKGLDKGFIAESQQTHFSMLRRDGLGDGQLNRKESEITLDRIEGRAPRPVLYWSDDHVAPFSHESSGSQLAGKSYSSQEHAKGDFSEDEGQPEGY